MKSRTLTEAQAAAQIGVNPETLGKWRRTGTRKIYFRQVGRLIRYLPEDVELTLKAMAAENVEGESGAVSERRVLEGRFG